ncbi:hypothetical protein [Nocardiopsis sp. CC223A]|nr:hypothetical protein [Nocardiopsis sp. CC223A]
MLPGPSAEPEGPMTNTPRIPLDTSVPHSARVVNYRLGGKP